MVRYGSVRMYGTLSRVVLVIPMKIKIQFTRLYNVKKNVSIRNSSGTVLQSIRRRAVPKAKLAKLFDLNLMNHLNMEKASCLKNP